MLSVSIGSFGYSEKVILKNIDFKLEKGEHLAILGESGCGKSTLLHLIYGLLHLEHGSLSWNGKQLRGPKYNLVPGELFIKLVAQEFNVMPFISVSENIASHLSRMDQLKDDQRVAELLKVVDLQDFANARVQHLSGGQKQRVALAKAIANQPELLLLDEPFSNIDTFRKNKIRRDLYRYLKENNISCITATHDSEEALGYADKLLLIKENIIEASGTPENVYKNVENVYQASFFGEVNLLPAKIFHSDSNSDELIVFPHQLGVTSKKGKLQVTVKNSYFRGSYYLIQADWEGQDVFFENSKRLKNNSIVKLVKK